MAPIDKTWSDIPPPPLPSYPPATEHDPAAARWLLGGFAGRATVQIGRRCVVGSGPSCDLCLVEWSIAPHHALLTVEEGELYITPLSDAATRVDGGVLEGRLRLAADSVVTFGDIDFAVEVQVPEAPRAHAPLGPAPADQLPPRPDPGVRGVAEPSTVEPPRRSLAPIALGIAVPLALVALWFYRADQWPSQLDLVAENAETATVAMPSNAPATIAFVPSPEAASAPPAPAQETATPAVALTPNLDTAQVTPKPDAVAAPVSPTPDLVDAPLPPSPGAAVVQVTAIGNTLATPPALEATLPPPRADLGPPLVFAPRTLLVDVAQLQSVDSRVKPPWSDQPPIAQPLRAAVGPPLIFPVSPPRVAVAQFQAVDTRVKPPWSDRPPIVAYDDALIFPVRPALFDIRAFETADARVKPPWSDIAPVCRRRRRGRGSAGRRRSSTAVRSRTPVCPG